MQGLLPHLFGETRSKAICRVGSQAGLAKGHLPAQGTQGALEKTPLQMPKHRELADEDCFSHSETPGEMVYLARSKQMFGEGVLKTTLQRGEICPSISLRERPCLTRVRREAGTQERPKVTPPIPRTVFSSDR